jgi:SWI/SNF-related matrix-associated actin-dependent regulator of chromatin subfamily A3
MGDMSGIDAMLNTSNQSQAAGMYTFRIEKSSAQLFLTFPDGTKFGILNNHIAKALEDIVEQPSVQFDALAHILTLRETIGRATKAIDAVVRVNINVYGPKEVGEDVGRHLSAKKVYLQRPDQQRPGSIYDNPHVLKFPDMQIPSIDYHSEGANESSLRSDNVEHFRKTISDVYGSLKRGSKLKRVEGDNRLRTLLLP